MASAQQTGQTDLRAKSAKLNLYMKGAKKTKSAANYARNMQDDRSGERAVRAGGTRGGAGREHRTVADEYEPNLSMLKSEETTLLENIAVNFEKLNNSLSKSLTPCLSGRIRNGPQAPLRGKQQPLFSRTGGLTTPHGADKDVHSFIAESNEMQFGQTQPVVSSTLFNIRNVNKNLKSKPKQPPRNMRKNFNSTHQSTGTVLSSPDDTMLLSLQPGSKSGYFKLGTAASGRQSNLRLPPYQLDMSAHIANCKKIRKNFIQNGVMDYDVNQISNLNFENQLSQKNLHQNVSFNIQKSLS